MHKNKPPKTDNITEYMNVKYMHIIQTNNPPIDMVSKEILKSHTVRSTANILIIQLEQSNDYKIRNYRETSANHVLKNHIPRSQFVK